MRGWDGSRFPRRPSLPAALSCKLSIFNLSCGLPIGSSATRRSLIGRSARCAIRASLLPALLSTRSAAMQRGLLLTVAGNQAPHSPFKTRRLPALLPFVRHASWSAPCSTVTRSDSLPPCALSQSVCTASILHKLSVSLPLSVSPSLSFSSRTAHTHTHTTFLNIHTAAVTSTVKGPHAAPCVF